jgi:hypothetical protein
MIAYTESKGWGVKCAWKEGSKLYKDNVGTPLWHFRTGTCSVPPFSLFRLKSIHNARKPQKSNSYRTIDANYADILVSLAIKSHFTESVRWYEDRISFPNQCGFSQFILRRKKGNKPSIITYGCRIYLSWKIYSTSFIKFIGWWNIFHKFLLTCICSLTRWRQLVDLPHSAKWWRSTHNLPEIPRSYVHVPVHVRLLNLSNICECGICF